MIKDLPSGKLLQDIIQGHGIDVPVMRTRLVGDRLELYLYGGGCVIHDLDSAVRPGNTTGQLECLTLNELRGVAKAQGIKGYSSMKKAVLVELLAKD